MMKRKGTLLTLACLLALGAQAESTYRWVDKDGAVHYSDVPPPSEVRQVEVRKLKSANIVDTDEQPYAARKAAADHPVTIYTSPDCHDECTQARSFLTERGIPYGETVIAKPEDLEAHHKTFGPGEALAPSITVGNTQKARGFSRTTWTSMLDLAGYPSARAK